MQRIAIGLTVVTLLVSLVLPLVSGPVRAGAPVLVVMPPWFDRDLRISTAGGRVVGLNTAPFGVLANSPSDEFAERLRSAGAWAVWDGAKLARICGVTL